jgi:SAM-dependent methyltransferase
MLRRLQGCYERWLEGRLDRRYGMDTGGIHDDLRALGAGGQHCALAYGYEGVQPAIFRAMVKAAAIAPGEFDCVDFGSGKGRALVLAAECGFRRVIGVELAPQLHAIACRNIAAFRGLRPLAPPIDLHCGDAAELPLPAGDMMLFLFNPFAEPVVAKVAANISRALRERPRRLVIAYRNPLHAEVFDELDCVEPMVRNRSFALYCSRAHGWSRICGTVRSQ